MKSITLKRAVLWLLLALAIVCIESGCTGLQHPDTPDHGTLGQQVPMPQGWYEYINNGGE